MAPSMTSIRRCLEGPRAEGVRLVEACIAEHDVDDPEALFLLGLPLALVGEFSRALELVQRAVTGGFYATPTLARDPLFDLVRTEPAFREILARAKAGREKALAAFHEGGGESLLGVTFT